MTAATDGTLADGRPVLPPGRSPFERHLLVCVSGKTCPDRGGEEVHLELRLACRDRFGTDRIRINKSGCLAQCALGPIVVVYPDDVWYAGVTVDDVPELIEEHIVHGRPVERLLLRGHGPGQNVD